MHRIAPFFALPLVPLALPNEASAQVSVNDSGDITVRSQSFTFETGEQFNSSEIFLPELLIPTVEDRVIVPNLSPRLAPSTVNVSLEEGYVEGAIAESTGLDLVGYKASITGDVSQQPGEHTFAEGVIVDNPDGTVETAIVAGDVVVQGIDGEELPSQTTATVRLSEGESATVRVVHINNNTPEEISDSGISFSESGELLVEDGGDEGDFADGDVFSITGGKLIADLQGEQVETVETSVQSEWSLESRSMSNVLGFLDDEGNSTNTNRLSITNEGELGWVYQTAPLFSNKRPTLLTAELGVDPFASTNSEILGFNVGATQFLTSISRDGTSTEGEASDIIEVLPPTLEAGPGDSAYSNTGGFIVNYFNGASEFIVQWTDSDRLEESVFLRKSDVESIVQALIPEQNAFSTVFLAGQSVPLYREANGYFTEEGLFLIARDKESGNFLDLTNTLTGVEDTLPGLNTVVRNFDGVQRPETIDYNDGFLSLEVKDVLSDTPSQSFKRGGVYIGGNASIGFGNIGTVTTTTQHTTETTGVGYFDISSQGELSLTELETDSETTSVELDSTESSSFSTSPVRAEGVLGYVYNYGGQPWTESADTIRLELHTGFESGVRAEVRNNFLGGNKSAFVRAGYRFDGTGDVLGGLTFSF